MKYLKVKAGKKAYELLKKEGLKPEIIRIMAGAAGGPKWILLYELDKYLINNFFTDPEQTIHFIGGSIGAWRSACYVVNDREAIDRLKYGYLNQRYRRPLTKDEVTDTCYDIIVDMLGDQGITDILAAQNRFLHIITSRAKFQIDPMTNKDISLKWKLSMAALLNVYSRKSMNAFFQRDIFTNSSGSILLDDGIDTRITSISSSNILPALQASGAIPVTIHPVNINKNQYWDGGIVDYHLDLKCKMDEGIVFYPHFLPDITPGWFDKFVPWRKSQYYENTLLLYPSEVFINMLPDKKLTSREDFYTYKDDPDLRIKKWYQAADLGKYLVDDFLHLLDKNILIDHLEKW